MTSFFSAPQGKASSSSVTVYRLKKYTRRSKSLCCWRLSNLSMSSQMAVFRKVCQLESYLLLPIFVHSFRNSVAELWKFSCDSFSLSCPYVSSFLYPCFCNPIIVHILSAYNTPCRVHTARIFSSPLQIQNYPCTALSSPSYALLLCFGKNFHPSGAGPRNISETLTQSFESGLARSVSLKGWIWIRR